MEVKEILPYQGFLNTSNFQLRNKCFYENFAEQVVISSNCPKGRKVTKCPSVGESKNSVKE